MFASWSAGEYGNIGATEWLEASTDQLYEQRVEIVDGKSNIPPLCLLPGLHVLGRQECFHLHQPGRSGDG